MIKSVEVNNGMTGVITQTGEFTIISATLGTADEFAADYLHDSKHVFNANSLNPLYQNWFIGGRKQNIQELDERDASEFAVRVGGKIDLSPEGLWKYQSVLVDSICNYQWWRTSH